MSFRGLVGGECGGSNSLVKLSEIVGRDARGDSSRADLFVDEYMSLNGPPPPQTFRMDALLNTLTEDRWMREFERPPVANHAWNASASPQPFQRRPPPQMPPRGFGPNFSFAERPVVPLQYLEEPLDVTDRVQEKARDLVDAVVDQNMAYNQFVSFMKKIGGGEASLVMPENAAASENVDVLNPGLEKFAETEKEEQWSKLKSELEHPWLSSVNLNSNPYPAYSFARDNDMRENPDALEIGKQKLKSGDVPGAVLCFEASVERDPTLVEGWLLLGTTQAENEQDPQAIPALVKCVELNPACLPAYMALGVSYTNENYPHLAYRAFNDWLKANGQYSDLVPLDVDISNMNNVQLQDHIQSLFIRAAQMNPTKIDADVQCALGVLFNISQEYNKAVDCFKAALMVRSDDSRLWNKLGATLANGDRSEEAVDAYYQALSLEPGFIRARYNIGITCMNLSAYKEAAEHFLMALNQQAKAQGMTPNVTQEHVSSATIWSTFRMVCAFMGKHELTSLIDNRDLNQLNKYFEIEQ